MRFTPNPSLDPRAGCERRESHQQETAAVAGVEGCTGRCTGRMLNVTSLPFLVVRPTAVLPLIIGTAPEASSVCALSGVL